MNTRLQVEHPVTELVIGLDLVHLQLAVAAGEPLPFTQEAVRLRGHAIEVRIYAEDPRTYLPSTGPVVALVAPQGPGIRNDIGLAGGDEVTVHYDPMIAKLIVHAPDRASAIGRLRRALDDYTVFGPTSNLALLRAIAADPAFAAGKTHTGFLDEAELDVQAGSTTVPDEVLVAAAVHRDTSVPEASDPFAALWRGGAGRRIEFDAGNTRHTVTVEGDGDSRVVTAGGDTWQVERAWRDPHLTLRIGSRQERFVVLANDMTTYIQWRGQHYTLRSVPGLTVDALALDTAKGHGHASLEAPMSGTVVKVLVTAGQAVAANEPLIVLEAMKMEHTIAAPHAGVVARLPFGAGELVAGGATVVELDAVAEAE